VITDAAAAQASVRDDLAGAAVAVAADGSAAIR
jgi:acetyl-CoA C-acetyltransferase